jgi:branched-chain amino acid transport system ATP-binding protein
MPLGEAILRVEGVTKRFGGLVALDGVTFAVRPGEITGVIGPNGAGKTTLFHVISGLLPATAGRVYFQGRVISDSPPHVISRLGLARTFQVVRPFPGLTVLENLTVGGLGNRVFDRGTELAEARARATEVAARVGLLPVIDRHATVLPHGSLKRLEIGRAIMTRPSLLLLDEPFAGLGGYEIADVARLVQELSASGMTLIIIEHKLRVLMRLVARVIVLNFGRQIGDGTPREIGADPVVQEAYLGEKGAARFA